LPPTARDELLESTRLRSADHGVLVEEHPAVMAKVERVIHEGGELPAAVQVVQQRAGDFCPRFPPMDSPQSGSAKIWAASWAKRIGGPPSPASASCSTVHIHGMPLSVPNHADQIVDSSSAWLRLTNCGFRLQLPREKWRSSRPTPPQVGAHQHGGLIADSRPQLREPPLQGKTCCWPAPSSPRGRSR
jgi:hypothetical protein